MKIAILPGDGIGPEITAQAVKVLKALGESFELESAEVGGAGYAAHGHPLPGTVKTEAGQEHKIRDGGGFTLQFVAPESSRLQQGIYPIKHPKLGTLEVFLVPTGPVHDGHGFHAVFG